MSDSVWASVLTFGHQDDVYDPPLAYQGEEHYPLSDDLRGGLLEVAEVEGWQYSLSPMRYLRIGVVSCHDNDDAVVLDLVQAARLHEALGAWLGVDQPLTAADLT